MADQLISFIPPLLILSIIIFFYYRHKRKQKTLGITPKRGVEGWLALLVLSLLVFAPLSAGSILTEISNIEQTTPGVLKNPNWAAYKTTNIWLMAFFIGVSIYGGYGLWKERTKAVVNRTYFVLWIIGPIRVLIVGLALPALFFNFTNSGEDFFAKLLQGFLSALVWTLYLKYSTRVKETYTDNLLIEDKSLETIHE